MKKIILLFSALFAFVACGTDDATKDENIPGVPDPSFSGPMVHFNLFFIFTNSEGENILDPNSPAYIGNDHLPQYKIYGANEYIPAVEDTFRIWNTSNPTDDGVSRYYLNYDMRAQLWMYNNDIRDLTLDRMWTKAQIIFDDGVTYEIYSKLEHANYGTYLMYPKEIYINNELIYQTDKSGKNKLIYTIVKD